MQDALRLSLRNRFGFVVGAKKAGNLGSILDEMVGLVGQIHFDQDIARKEFSLRIDFLSAPYFHDLLRRHHDFFEEVVEVALLRLLANRVGDLAFKVRIRLDDVPMLFTHFCRLLQPPMPSTNVTKTRMIWSATRKNMDAAATMTNTMAVVTRVSRPVGHVTFWASARTSCMNLNGLIFAMSRLPQT